MTFVGISEDHVPERPNNSNLQKRPHGCVCSHCKRDHGIFGSNDAIVFVVQRSLIGYVLSRDVDEPACSLFASIYNFLVEKRRPATILSTFLSTRSQICYSTHLACDAMIFRYVTNGLLPVGYTECRRLLPSTSCGIHSGSITYPTVGFSRILWRLSFFFSWAINHTGTVSLLALVSCASFSYRLTVTHFA
jgi:hypothetical protein